MTAAEFVRTDNVNTEIPEATEVGVLDDEVAATGLAVALFHRWNIAATGAQARVVADLLRRSQDGLMCVQYASCMCGCAASMLLACVDVIPVHVNDVPIAGADKLRGDSLLQLGNRHTNVLAEPGRPRGLALHHWPRG